LGLHLPFKQAQDAATLTHTGRYLKTVDAAAFSREVSLAGLHPNPTAVLRVLDDPVLRPILPPVLRGSDARPWIIKHARWLNLASSLGLVLALLLAARGHSHRPDAPVPAPPAAY
jgi:hypothetical protein